LIIIIVLTLSMSRDVESGLLGFAIIISIVFGVCAQLYLNRRRLGQYQQLSQLEAQAQAIQMRRLHSLHPGILAHINPTHLSLAMTERDFNANDYETLLHLDEEMRQMTFTGIPQSQIERLPTHTVSQRDVEQVSKLAPCTGCLETPKAGDVLRTLPCLHKFHAHCVDRWLRTKPSCPVCTFHVTLT